MIKNPKSYPRGRGENINTKCKVIVVCDDCGIEWETQYSNYLRKIGHFDLCQSCKNEHGICGMKGRKHSEATKKNFSKDRRGDGNGFYGKKHSDHTVQSLKATHAGISFRPPFTDADKTKASESLKQYWQGLSAEEKAARLANYDFASMRKRLLYNSGRYSKLHQHVKAAMNDLGLSDFDSEEQVGLYVVDELSKDRRVAIEVNGDYWHANPEKYDANEIIAFPAELKRAKDIWEHDRRKEDHLVQAGYRVITIWESDVKNNKYLEILKGLSS